MSMPVIVEVARTPVGRFQGALGMAALLAGIPYEVPAVTVNRLCASGLEAVNQAARMIRVGDAKRCVGGRRVDESGALVGSAGARASQGGQPDGLGHGAGVPVVIEERHGLRTVSVDEAPRRDTTRARLAGLRAVFRDGGTVTAGNSSPLNDSACPWMATARAHRGVCFGGCRPRGDGPGPCTGHAQGAGASRPVGGGCGRLGTQRGVRRPVPRGHA